MWWAVVAGMLISCRWIVLGFQARAGVGLSQLTLHTTPSGLPGAGGGGGQGEQLGEGRQVTGQGHDQAPGTVLREALQGEVVEPGVFCAADAVPWRRVRSWWRTLRSAS